MAIVTKEFVKNYFGITEESATEAGVSAGTPAGLSEEAGKVSDDGKDWEQVSSEAIKSINGFIGLSVEEKRKFISEIEGDRRNARRFFEQALKQSRRNVRLKFIDGLEGLSSERKEYWKKEIIRDGANIKEIAAKVKEENRRALAGEPPAEAGTRAADNAIDGRIELMIGLVEKDYQNIRNMPFDKDEKGNVVYPDGAEETAALMVMHKINNAGKISVSGGSVKSEQTVSSESWGDHAISYQNGKDGLNQSGELRYGYPAEIVARIQRYVGFKAVK